MKGIYKDQIKRMIRSFDQLPTRNSVKKIDDSVIDKYYHFCQDCLYLKDWIKNDNSLNEVIRKEVENYINKSRYLKQIVDIANATKHLTLDKYVRCDKNIDFEIIAIYVGAEKQSEMLGITLIDDSNKTLTTEAILLAKRGMREWDRFLYKFNLGRILLIEKGGK
jgi:hypothetical protein